MTKTVVQELTWKVVDGVMTYQHPGMIGRVELLGKGTPADPYRFSWSVAWTTGSGQPISGEEKNLQSACKQVEHHFDPAVISAQVQSLIVKASEQTIDFMQPDMITCRHKQEDHCDCICHQPYKGIIIHDRACCNPCMGCGFREVIRI